MAQPQRIVIKPGTKNSRYWKDLWTYRGLFYFLSWRDIIVRYKQTAIGITWSVIRPLLTILIMTFIFQKGAHFSSDNGMPYAIMVCAGMLPWQFFSNAFSESSNSLVTNSNLLTKVYFPRIIVPISSVIVSLIDFCISLAIMGCFFVFYRYTPDWHILFLPIFLILAIITSIGSGLFIASLNVKYRDFKHIIPFIVQFGLYISPVGYSSSIICKNLSPVFKYAYFLNPMAGVIDGFRWCIGNGENSLFLPGMFLSIIVSLLLLIIGVFYFRRSEKKFADII